MIISILALIGFGAIVNKLGIFEAMAQPKLDVKEIIKEINWDASFEAADFDTQTTMLKNRHKNA